MTGSRTATRLGVGFVVASFVVAAVAYPSAPERMVIRWWVGPGMELHVDHASKAVALFVVPTLSAALFGAFRFGPDLVGGAVADDTVSHVFASLATGLSALLFVVELALVWFN